VFCHPEWSEAKNLDFASLPKCFAPLRMAKAKINNFDTLSEKS